MGRFSSTVHIKSNTDKSKFKDSFCDVMKKRGFEPCSEKDAALSYLFAFSDGGWVTLSSDRYSDNTNQVHEDVRQIAEKMKTSGFSVEIVDSDFAILELNGGGFDTVIIGDGSGYGIDAAPKGKQECWKQLLAKGKTWEQLSEIWTKDEVFDENTLCVVASLLGIEPKYITADYEELFDKADSDSDIVLLYYKKSADTKREPISLNAAFVKVFGEGLETLGFKKIKGRQPYFVRIVSGGEIIHVITVKKECPYLLDSDAFTILSGVATVYRPKIDLSISPKMNVRWLSDIQRIYVGTNRSDYDSDFRNGFFTFSYTKDDGESQFKTMQLALERTKSIVIPMLNDVVDVDSCARFCFIMNVPFKPDVHFNKINGISDINPNDIADEGLLIMKIKDYHGFVDWGVEYYKIFYKEHIKIQRGAYTEEGYSDYCNRIGELKQEEISKMSRIVNDTQFYNSIMLELENRKRLNEEIMRSYKIGF